MSIVSTACEFVSKSQDNVSDELIYIPLILDSKLDEEALVMKEADFVTVEKKSTAKEQGDVSTAPAFIPEVEDFIVPEGQPVRQ